MTILSAACQSRAGPLDAWLLRPGASIIENPPIPDSADLVPDGIFVWWAVLDVNQ